MGSHNIVLLFAFGFVTAVKPKQVQIGFIISGSDDFGGHSMEIHTPAIMKIVEKLSLKLNLKIQQRGMESFYGLIWTYPGQQPQHQVAIGMTFVKDFRQQFQTWMDAPPRGILSESVGFEGVVSFAKNELFDSSEGVIHAIVALTEQAVPGAEVAYFLRDKCPPVISVIIFPRKNSDCENKRLLSRLGMFRNNLNSKYKGNLVVCSKNQRSTDRLATVLFENLHTSEEMAKTCGRKSALNGTRSKGPQPEETTAAPTAAPCHHIMCSFYAWVAIGGTFVGLLCFCTAVLALVCNYLTRKRWTVSHPSVCMTQNSVTNTIDPRRMTLLVELSSSPVDQSIYPTSTKTSQLMSQSLTSECESSLSPKTRNKRKGRGKTQSGFVTHALGAGLGSAPALGDPGTLWRGRNEKGIGSLVMISPDSHAWFPRKSDAASTSSLCEEDVL